MRHAVIALALLAVAGCGKPATPTKAELFDRLQKGVYESAFDDLGKALNCTVIVDEDGAESKSVRFVARDGYVHGRVQKVSVGGVVWSPIESSLKIE